MPSDEHGERVLLLLLALLFEHRAPREHHVAAAAVELDDLGPDGLAHHGAEVLDRPEVDLRAGQERAHAHVHREAALDDLHHAPLDGRCRSRRTWTRVPDLDLVGLVLGEDDEALVVLLGLEVDLDLVADLRGSRCAGTPRWGSSPRSCSRCRRAPRCRGPRRRARGPPRLLRCHSPRRVNQCSMLSSGPSSTSGGRPRNSGPSGSACPYAADFLLDGNRGAAPATRGQPALFPSLPANVFLHVAGVGAAPGPRSVSSRRRAIARIISSAASRYRSRRASAGASANDRGGPNRTTTLRGRGTTRPRGRARARARDVHGHHRGAAQHRQHARPRLGRRDAPPRPRGFPPGTRAAPGRPRALAARPQCLRARALAADGPGVEGPDEAGRRAGRETARPWPGSRAAGVPLRPRCGGSSTLE